MAYHPRRGFDAILFADQLDSCPIIQRLVHTNSYPSSLRMDYLSRIRSQRDRPMHERLLLLISTASGSFVRNLLNAADLVLDQRLVSSAGSRGSHFDVPSPSRTRRRGVVTAGAARGIHYPSKISYPVSDGWLARTVHSVSDCGMTNLHSSRRR